jgi:hypothetical protein
MWVAYLAVMIFISALSCGPKPLTAAAESGLVELVPIALDPKEPERKEFGALTLLSAYELRSRDKRFGGLSGLWVESNGRLYAVSDRGYWFSARLKFDSDGRLANLTDGDIQPLRDSNGKPISGNWYDAEALTRAPDGSFVVAFEQAHRLWRYPPSPGNFHSTARPVSVPPELARAPANGGLEGIAYLPDGRLLALTEEFQNEDGSFKGWLLENSRFAELSYLPSDGFRVTDCAALPNGDVVVLERRYVPLGIWHARLKLVSGRGVRGEAKLIGEEILKLEAPLHVDNFEGVAVAEDAKGTMIYVISDDNYSALQRTLLLQFRLPKTGN